MKDGLNEQRIVEALESISQTLKEIERALINLRGV